MNDKLHRLFHNSEGQTIVEYGLLASLIVLVAVTLLSAAHGHGTTLVAMAATATSR
jgi:Flp pilus assembly pilin Flp